MNQEDRTIRKESSGTWIHPQRVDSTTTRMESHKSISSNLSRSLSFSDKLITGIIAIALMCIAPIIPILIAFGVGHFTRYNADKLKREREHERTNARRY